jgi:hypothetical protein
VLMIFSLFVCRGWGIGAPALSMAHYYGGSPRLVNQPEQEIFGKFRGPADGDRAAGQGPRTTPETAPPFAGGKGWARAVSNGRGTAEGLVRWSRWTGRGNSRGDGLQEGSKGQAAGMSGSRWTRCGGREG